MSENILHLTGQSQEFKEGIDLNFPKGYFIDGEGNRWEIVNPKAGNSEVVVQMAGNPKSVQTIGLTDALFERFIPNSSMEGMMSLLRERFKR